MSERKTAEVKFRCTPTFKAGLQTAAEAAGENVSEYIEAAVWARQNAALDGTALVDSAIKALEPESEQALALERAVPVVDDDAPAEVPVVVCSCRPWEFCPHKERA